MTLWIRTQDKESLLSVTFLHISNERTIGKNGFAVCSGGFDLGTYETEERALEILNEIQEFMTFDEKNYEGNNKTSYQLCNVYKSNVLMIYNMPKE